MAKAVLAIDVGATNLRVALYDLRGKLLIKEVTRTPRAGGELAIANEIIRRAVRTIRVTGREVVAIGVGTIGPLDIRRGDVVNTPNNPLRNFKLRSPLKNYFNVPTYVVNDCVAAVWGEYWVGAGKGYSNVVYITLSTGIGAGAIVNNSLLLGKDGNAHEVGHIVLDFKGRVRCGCGGLGHWEGMASGSGIPKYAYFRAKRWRGRNTDALKDALRGSLTSEKLFRYWRLGDAFAKSVVKDLVKINAAGLASVINVYDPEVVSIGGSIALRNKDFIRSIIRKVKVYVTNRMPKITITPLGDDVVLIGAAYIALKPPENLIRVQY